MSGLEGKIAIITGAAQGVGRATAERAARLGAHLLLADRHSDLCVPVRDAIVGAGGTAEVVSADLETCEGNLTVVQAALQHFGQIDVAVFNVGGVIRPKPFWDYTPVELEREVSRSLWPALWGCHSVLPVMREQGFGAIVNIGSAAVRWMWRVPYSASKAGVHAMTHCIARELADTGIRINCVAPGALTIEDRITDRSPQAPSGKDRHWRDEAVRQSLEATPLGRAGTAQEIAAAICFLASDEASYITGTTLYAAGGETA